MNKKHFIEPGMEFDRLHVVEQVFDYHRKGQFWLCLCECGIHVTVEAMALGNGRTKSCGCLRMDMVRAVNATHGYHGHRLYSTWSAMKARCNNPKTECWERYGGRGITYHPSFETFEGFLAGIPDGYRDDLTIDRIDVNGDYEPGNLRWATPREQSLNRRNTVRFKHPLTGEPLLASDLCEEYGVSVQLFRRRIASGKSVTEALNPSVAVTGLGLDLELIKDIKRTLWHLSSQDAAMWHNVSPTTTKRIKSGQIYGDIEDY